MALLCHCHVVTERCIEDAVRQGATSVSEVEVHCSAGTSCGGCVSAIEVLLQQMVARLDGAAA